MPGPAYLQPAPTPTLRSAGRAGGGCLSVDVSSMIASHAFGNPSFSLAASTTFVAATSTRLRFQPLLSGCSLRDNGLEDRLRDILLGTITRSLRTLYSRSLCTLLPSLRMMRIPAGLDPNLKPDKNKETNVADSESDGDDTKRGLPQATFTASGDHSPATSGFVDNPFQAF
ncbi:hypothetical protein BU26DRAFT_581778 [Trematosphaeria pertusa]|uniref:Uncharacterized protein n=1 Tax=Trematosphaeria pertusa TaxID=390896 RepID=A0A6A6I0X5_9PLEO|nr:uncharacterized protein BU26DRAFT_581778 [Trematosphaeria pertusa]KAF2243553.1 hypothetical protein BU26DRAFT_581778 [Trematosphaeria pertusa]